MIYFLILLFITTAQSLIASEAGGGAQSTPSVNPQKKLLLERIQQLQSGQLERSQRRASLIPLLEYPVANQATTNVAACVSNNENDNNLNDENSLPTPTNNNSASSNQSSLFTQFCELAPNVAAAGAGAVSIAYLNNAGSRPQTRSLLSAGDVFGAGSIAKAVAVTTAIGAGLYVFKRISNGLHYGCEQEKIVLEQRFEAMVNEMEARWAAELQRVMTEQRSAILRDQNNLIERINGALADQKEEYKNLFEQQLEISRMIAETVPDDPDAPMRSHANLEQRLATLRTEIQSLKDRGHTITPNQVTPDNQIVQFTIPQRPKESCWSCC